MCTLCLLTALLCGAPQQNADWYKDLADFTKSPTEHIVAFLDEPIEVRSVEGVIKDPSEYPRSGVIFEIRGPGNDRIIRRAQTGTGGRFRIRRVRKGTYRFKATLDGFKSVVGTIVVTKKADKTRKIDLVMEVGV